MAETRDMDGVFIDVEVDALDRRATPSWRAKLEEVCPVDIFAARRRRRRRSCARTSTSACSASSASTRRRTAPCAVKKLYDGTELRR